MKLLQAIFVAMAMWWGGVSPCCAAISFTDGFEGATLNPFWTVSTSNGSITFPSTTQVHSGSQSVRFNTTGVGQDKSATLSHSFGAGIYGTFSVWMYDTGADQFSSNYIYLQLDGLGDRAGLGTTDYDLGPGQNGSTYQYSPNYSTTLPTSIDRTLGWHNFRIETSPTLVRFSIDGTQVFQENQGLAVTSLGLYLFAPGFRPAWTAYFDDFSVQEANTVPEPSTLVLFGGTALGMLLSTRRRRVKRVA